MPENINNLNRLAELKNDLIEKRVSESSVGAIEKALRNGLVFRRAADLSILNLPAADVEILGTAVTFGALPPEANVKTLQLTFVPKGDKDNFYGYQFLIDYINRDRFSVSESYPIEDSRIVYVDLDLNDVAGGTKVIYRVKTPQGDFSRIALGDSSEPGPEPIEVAPSALASATITVAVDEITTANVPDALVSYRVKGKLIFSADDKLDGLNGSDEEAAKRYAGLLSRRFCDNRDQRLLSD